jgi:hypothetical protein
MQVDKQQLETKIANMEKELAEMRKLLATPDLTTTYWQPNEVTPDYWYVSPNLTILCQTLNPKNDKSPRYRVFKTKTEAKRYADYIKAEEILKKAIADLNQGWVPDFNNDKENKYYIYYSTYSVVPQTEICLCRKEQPTFMYMKSKEIAKIIKTQYKDTLITYFSY